MARQSFAGKTKIGFFVTIIFKISNMILSKWWTMEMLILKLAGNQQGKL
jgi:hypothetical protein